jgi:hypothetical protein
VNLEKGRFETLENFAVYILNGLALMTKPVRMRESLFDISSND